MKMREIKFRGINKNSNAWLYGMPTCNFEHLFGEIVYDSVDNHEVISETVGQFTGFHDCKGKEIYEGDIIGDWTDVDGVMEQSKLQVYFDEMLGQWMLDHSVEQDKTLSCSLFEELKDFEYEVLGNIYDK